MRVQNLLAGATLLALGAIATAHAAKINVNDTVQKEINNNANARAAVLGAMGVKDAKWQITAVKVTALRPGEVKVTLPKEEMAFVTATTITNCAPTGTSREINLSEEVTNSVTVRKSDTLEVGAEVSVSAEYMGVGASATGSTSYSVTNEREQTSERRGTVSDTVTVSFDDKGGRMSVLKAAKVSGDSILWTAKFTPGDDDLIEFTAAPPGGGEVCFYDGIKYEGKSRCFGPGNHASFGKGWDGTAFSIKVPKGYSAELYQFADFKGAKREIDDSERATISGGPMSVMKYTIGSAKIKGPGTKASVKFAAIKSSLPEAARTFAVSGTMKISQTAFNKKEVINYELTPEQVQQNCSSPAGPVPASAPQGASAIAARKPTEANVRTQRLTEADWRKLSTKAKPVAK